MTNEGINITVLITIEEAMADGVLDADWGDISLHYYHQKKNDSFKFT